MPHLTSKIMAYQHHLSPEQTPDTAAPDLLLLNANVLTLEPQLPHAEAVAIRGQTIIAVGHRKDVASHAGPGTRTNVHGLLFHCDDCRQQVADLKSKGVNITLEPEEQPWGFRRCSRTCTATPTCSCNQSPWVRPGPVTMKPPSILPTP